MACTTGMGVNALCPRELLKQSFRKTQCLGEGQTSKILMYRRMILFNYQQLEAGQRRDKERQVVRIT